MRTTIRDIADRARVSHTTVSRVLNGRGAEFISESTRQKVLAMAAEMNYRPNQAARALATGRTNIIALWMPVIHLPYFTGAMHCTEQQLKQHGYDFIIHRTTRSNEHPGDSSWPVDGILAFDGPEEVQHYLAANPVSHLPIVSMGSFWVDTIDFVGVDLAFGTHAALQHLLAIGCRRIAFLFPRRDHRAQDSRHNAYTTAMQQAGKQPEYIDAGENSRASARRCLRDYVQEHGCPDGLFCFNDDLAIGAYRGLCDLGIRVPEDIALIGCDGIEDTEYLETPLSTIAQPHEQMCALAWQFLKQRIQNESLPLQQKILRPQLILRESSQRGTQR